MVSKVSCNHMESDVDRSVAGRKGITNLKNMSLLVKTNHITLQDVMNLPFYHDSGIEYPLGDLVVAAAVAKSSTQQ